MPTPIPYALSLKQPWAALVAHGKKTIEVRRWSTIRRGRILIHAARISDDRPEAWALVPTELKPAALQVGGIVGAAELTECISYRTARGFAADQARHLNLPQWWQGPIMFGFHFRGAEALPFRVCSGWMRFFPVHFKGSRQ